MPTPRLPPTETGPESRKEFGQHAKPGKRRPVLLYLLADRLFLHLGATIARRWGFCGPFSVAEIGLRTDKLFSRCALIAISLYLKADHSCKVDTLSDWVALVSQILCLLDLTQPLYKACQQLQVIWPTLTCLDATQGEPDLIIVVEAERMPGTLQIARWDGC